MTDETIKLIKDFLTNQDANNTIDRSFSELIPKRNRITINEFFDYYNNLFYDIPQQGALSHKELVDRSIEYLGNYSDSRDQEIADLNAEIDVLSQQINQLQLDQFESEFNDLTKTVIINLRLKSPSWDGSGMKHKDKETHRLRFQDFINSDKYIHGSYDDWRLKTFTFKTSSPTFTLYYNGRNFVENWIGNTHDDGVKHQLPVTTYSIPESDDTYILDLPLDGVRGYNLSYTDWQKEAAGLHPYDTQTDEE